MRLRAPATLVAVLLLGAASVFWIPDPSGKATSLAWRMADGRDLAAEYSSGYLAWAAAIVACLWASLVGFYLVAGTIRRDGERGVGAILAATPLPERRLPRREGAGASPLSRRPFAPRRRGRVRRVPEVGRGSLPPAGVRRDVGALHPPRLVLTASSAVLFDVAPVLRSRAGYVIWFFVFAILVSGVNSRDQKGRVVRAPRVDPLGMATLDWRVVKTMPGADLRVERAHLPRQAVHARPVGRREAGRVRDGVAPRLPRRRVSPPRRVPPLLRPLRSRPRAPPRRPPGARGAPRAGRRRRARARRGPRRVRPARALGIPVRARGGAAHVGLGVVGPVASPRPRARRAVRPRRRVPVRRRPRCCSPSRSPCRRSPRARASPGRAGSCSPSRACRPRRSSGRPARSSSSSSRSACRARRGRAWRAPAAGAAFLTGLLFTAGLAAGFGSLTGGGKLFLGVYTAVWYFAVNRLPIADFTGLFAEPSAARAAAFLLAGAAAVGAALATEVRARA